RQDLAAAAPAPAPRERLRHSHRAVDRSLPARRPAHGSASRGRRRPLRAVAEQPAGRDARAQLARQVLPAVVPIPVRESVRAGPAAGPITRTMAMGAAVRKARDAGVGLALVRATTHTAALGYYTLLAAQEGMAAIALAASGPFMAYHGTRAAGVSTNPISIAV